MYERMYVCMYVCMYVRTVCVHTCCTEYELLLEPSTFSIAE